MFGSPVTSSRQFGSPTEARQPSPSPSLTVCSLMSSKNGASPA
jgi:hypothetical protein